MNVEFNEKEVAALMQLIHIAVQARGMEVAEAGVILTKKFEAAVREQNPPKLVKDDKDVA